MVMEMVGLIYQKKLKISIFKSNLFLISNLFLTLSSVFIFVDVANLATANCQINTSMIQTKFKL